MHRLYSKISNTLYKTISSQVTFISKSLSKYIKNFLSKNHNHKNFSHRMWLAFEMKYKCLDFLLVSFCYYFTIHLAYENFGWLVSFITLSIFNQKEIISGIDIFITGRLIGMSCNTSHLSSTTLFCFFMTMIRILLCMQKATFLVFDS